MIDSDFLNVKPQFKSFKLQIRSIFKDFQLMNVPFISSIVSHPSHPQKNERKLFALKEIEKKNISNKTLLYGVTVKRAMFIFFNLSLIIESYIE